MSHHSLWDRAQTGVVFGREDNTFAKHLLLNESGVSRVNSAHAGNLTNDGIKALDWVGVDRLLDRLPWNANADSRPASD